jgi:hypothetical protein
MIQGIHEWNPLENAGFPERGISGDQERNYPKDWEI